MKEERFRTSVAFSAQIYQDQWSTHSENIAKARARRYAMLCAMKERDLAKPPRNTNYDGEIAKRRDKS